MNTGALRHLVTLETPNDLPALDPPDWRCASVGEQSGLATFIGRYRPDINTSTRILFKGRMFHVDTLVNREDRNVELVLTCHEVFA